MVLALAGGAVATRVAGVASVATESAVGAVGSLSSTDAVSSAPSNEAASSDRAETVAAAVKASAVSIPFETVANLRPASRHFNETDIVTASVENTDLTGGIGRVGHPAVGSCRKFVSRRMGRLCGLPAMRSQLARTT